MNNLVSFFEESSKSSHFTSYAAATLEPSTTPDFISLFLLQNLANFTLDLARNNSHYIYSTTPEPFDYTPKSSILTQLDENGTEIMEDSSPFETWSTSELVEMAYQMLLFTVGAPLNAFALFKFSRSQKHNSSEFRLIRLSRQLLIAHLMVLCVNCLWRTYWFYNIAWIQGDFLCKVYSFLSALPFHLWSNMVAAIAIDMVVVILIPLKSVSNGSTRVSWLIGISWAFGILCSLPMAVFRGVVPIPGTEYEQCYPLIKQFDEDILIAFHLFHVITTFYVPLIIILLCYFLIGFSLRNQIAKRKNLGNAKSCQNTTNRFFIATACIICTFVLTWLPYQVIALLRVICENGSTCETFVSKFNWLEAILITSTCINPFLYRFGIFKSSGSRRNQSSSNCVYFSALGNSGAAMDNQNLVYGAMETIANQHYVLTNQNNTYYSALKNPSRITPKGSSNSLRVLLHCQSAYGLADHGNKLPVNPRLISITAQHQPLCGTASATQPLLKAEETGLMEERKINSLQTIYRTRQPSPPCLKSSSSKLDSEA